MCNPHPKKVDHVIIFGVISLLVVIKQHAAYPHKNGDFSSTETRTIQGEKGMIIILVANH